MSRTSSEGGDAGREQAPGEREARGATGAGEIAKLPNADEATRQHVLDEAPEKLHRGERHRAPLIAVRVVLPAKGHALAVEGDQAVIADRDPMRVAPEVPQHRGGPAEGRFRIDDPVGLEERIDKGVPLRRIAQALGGAREVEVAARVGSTERGDKLSAKHATQDLHGEEEAGVLRTNPAPVIRRQAAGRHDAVDVRMPDERLPPRVEDAEDADLRAQVTRVGGDLAQRGRTRLKEPGVQPRGVAVAQRQQRVRQREDDMHVRHVEELALPGGEPPVARLRLTLRTVSIPTRVIGDGPMSAGATLIEMAAERGGPTPRQRAEDGPLLHAEPRMLLEEVLHPARGGHRPPPRRAGSRLGGLPLQTGPRHHRGRCHVQLLKGIRRRVEVPSREVEIHRRVRQIGVAQQELNRAQVGARFQQMRRVRVPQRVRRDAFVDPGLPRGQAHGLPDHLRGDRAIGPPAVVRPREEIGPRPHPAVGTRAARRGASD